VRGTESEIEYVLYDPPMAANFALSLARRRFLFELLPSGSIGAEIGVHEGDFSAVLLESVRPEVLHLVDPWVHEAGPRYEQAWYGGQAPGGQGQLDQRYEAVLDRFARPIAEGVVVVHRQTSKEFLALVDEASLDWVYIDGNHMVDFVRDDLQMSLRAVRPGGLITGDDYVDGGWWDGGVKQAVDEFVTTAPVAVVTMQGTQYVLERR